MPLKNYEKHGFTEAYEVVKTVDLATEDHRYRIQVLESASKEESRFSVRYFREEHIELQPTYPSENMVPVSKPRTMRVWADFDAAWVVEETAERALGQAISWLGERAG